LRPDLTLAATWYRKAAEQGNIHGQLSLGDAYQNGRGVPKDLVSAYMWMDLAAQQGPKFTTPRVDGFQSHQAQTARDEMVKQMSPAQIAEAQQRSRDWKPKVTRVGLTCSSPAFCGEIHDVAGSGNFERVKVLLKGSPDLVSSKDKNGMTPLSFAAGAGHADVVKRLLASKADVNARDNNGMTPLYAAAGFGHKDTVELLLANQADVNARDKNGITPLFVATFNSHAAVVKLLLASNADVNAAANNATTPLHVAAVKDVAALLLANKANVNARANGVTPLHFAALNGYTDVVRLLLTTNAEVNAKDDTGTTPLHLAVAKEHKDVVELLLAHKANVDSKDKNGVTPLYLAAGVDIAQLLLASMADVNAKDNRGATPLDVASASGHIDVANLIRQHGGHL
jgi:ankyrin repeat protein